jgi:hypothetical protein
MPRIVIITHTYDDFKTRHYLLRHIAEIWVQSGYRVSVVAGLGTWPDADIAILHVDLSLLPEAYVEAAKRYPVVLNDATTDIRKQQVSRNLVRPNDGWTGPVIIKTDLNSSGGPERRILKRMRNGSRSHDVPPAATSSIVNGEYRIVDSPSAVPDSDWEDQSLVVERFLPERDARGYWTRVWVFLGDRERCSRYLAPDPLVKSKNILLREPAPVPDALRAERRRLGFDYGKFDFAICNGEAVLFDTNRTPWAPRPADRAALHASNADLAQGIETCLNA